MKGRKVCIKTRLPPASLSLKGKVTKHTTVKWTICFDYELNFLDVKRLSLGNSIHFTVF